MPSRDIYSRDGGKKVRDLLASFFGVLLLSGTNDKPMYLISPWLSDFKLMDNAFGQFKDLFRINTSLGENSHILFSEAFLEASGSVPIRIITWPDVKSKAFACNFVGAKNIQIKFEKDQRDHQKGLLSALFYFEGSMNFTYSGVYKNREKIVCTAAYDPEGNRKINEAYLEFERIWDNLEATAN